LINNKYNKLKLLGSGDIKEKLDIEVNFISKSAKEKIEKSGGKVTLIK
jgi:large subunit ribosomal protein L15